MNMIKNKAVRNALFIGVLSSFSYLICYFRDSFYCQYAFLCSRAVGERCFGGQD